MNDRTLLRICGVLFCLLAVSNLVKPLELHAHHGFVFLGMRQRGVPNLILGPLFGLYLGVYGLGVLRRRSFALPMSYLYAGYVLVNLVLFAVRMPDEALARPLFGLVYAVIALGVSGGCAYLLARNRAVLT